MRDEVTSAKYLTLPFCTIETLFSWPLRYLSKPIYLIIFIYYKITNIRHKRNDGKMHRNCFILPWCVLWTIYLVCFIYSVLLRFRLLLSFFFFVSFILSPRPYLFTLCMHMHEYGIASNSKCCMNTGEKETEGNEKNNCNTPLVIA